MDFQLTGSGHRIQWTNEQIEYIKTQHQLAFVGPTALAKQFGGDRDAIKTVLRNCGVRVYKRGEYRPFNVAFFHDIDSHEKAYWLGLFFSDGTVGSDSSSHPNKIGLGMIDLEHIEKFRTAIGAINSKICVTYPKSFQNAHPYYQLSLYSQTDTTESEV